MKVVYLVRNPGINSRTPEGWRSAVIAASAGDYSEEDLLAVEDADVLVVGLEPVDEGLLARAPRLRLIQATRTGVLQYRP